jgi:hypothetical protein
MYLVPILILGDQEKLTDLLLFWTAYHTLPADASANSVLAGRSVKVFSRGKYLSDGVVIADHPQGIPCL